MTERATGDARVLHHRALFVLAVCAVATLAYGARLDHTYPIGDWLFWKVGAIWVWGFFLSVSCVSVGLRVVAFAIDETELPTLEVVVESAAVGLVVFVLGMYLGGFAGQYNAAFAVLLPAAMLASGGRRLLVFMRARHAAWVAERAGEGARSPVASLAAALGLLGLSAVYLSVMTPAAINFDAAWSHLTIAADYARAGRIVPFDGDYTRNFPHLASIVHTWAMLVPSWGVFTTPAVRWMLALHLEFFFFVWTLAGVSALTAWLVERRRVPGAWTAFFLFPAIFVYDKSLGGAADHYLAFFAAPLLLATLRAAPDFRPRAAGLVGIFAAGALLTKYQAVYLLTGVGLVFAGLWIATVLRSRSQEGPRPWGSLLAGPLALVVTFAAVVSPHFVKNWVYYGNPLYPFMQDVFASRPTTRHAAYLFEWLFKDARYRPHGTFAENVVDAIRLSFTWSFEPHYSFTRDVPDGGSLFTMCMPVALALRSRRLGIGYAAALGSLFAWAMIFRVDRHLQTFMPLIVAATAAALIRAWELGWPARAGLCLVVALQVIWGGDAVFYSAHARLSASIDLLRSGYDGHAATRFDEFRADDRAMSAILPRDARVLLHAYRPSLGIDREVVLDWAGQQGLILYEDVHGLRSLHELFRSVGVTHLLWIPGWHPASTKQEDVLFSEFMHRYRAATRHFGGEELLTLPTELPPADHAYTVLALGLTGYADGFYALEAMKTYEELPGSLQTFASPATPLPTDPAAQADLASRVDAVCLGESFHADVVLRTRIDLAFEPAVTYPHAFAIFVRREGGPLQPP